MLRATSRLASLPRSVNLAQSVRSLSTHSMNHTGIGLWRRLASSCAWISPPTSSLRVIGLPPSLLQRFTSPEDSTEKKHEESKKEGKKEDNKSTPEPPEEPEGPSPKYSYMIVGYGLLSCITAGYFLYATVTGTSNAFNWNNLKKEILDENVSNVTMSGHEAFVFFHDGETPKKIGFPNEKRFIEKLEGFQTDLGISPVDYVPIIHQSDGFFFPLVMTLLPLTLMGIILLAFNRRAGSGGGMVSNEEGVCVCGWMASNVS